MGVTGMDVDAEVLYGRGFAPRSDNAPERAINYVDPYVTPATIDGTTDYNYTSGHNPGGLSSYENELFTNP
jgi:hypothetical protein